MLSPVELRRIVAEWRLRAQRIKEIIQPPSWDEDEWRRFSQALALMVRDHGKSWIIEPNVYWDLRWKLQDGAELICQIEHVPGEKTSLVVAQNGGFADHVGSYTWLWAEFNMEGHFARDPYWVDGTWKEALTQLLLPLDRQASFFLAGRGETPEALLLQEGARPNDQHLSLMSGLEEEKPEAPKEKRVNQLDETPANTAPREDAATTVDITPTDATSVSAEPPSAPSPESANGNHTAEAAPRVDSPKQAAIRWGMSFQLTWKDTDDIAYALIDKFPDQDPLKLSFPKLHDLIIHLDDFKDDPQKSSEAILEAIQMAWYEEVK
jgi:FeS assembly protein IscX